ncbi:hypothetical protein TVNIR_2066 [Thioalkalivibrio nitratireducens DSM 14787]|uniref:Uncharacterized protein n=2 Tax=Thioalkalivibrio nitratireducens TaxID=186931 RepID=L0DZB0_THIND|nr:hypothetical protein TVNIR_2066 [Thioalkalivibrio nitratireducens DSM 14787]
MRWVLLLLVSLNLLYFAFGLYRSDAPDPYADVPPIEVFPDAVILELLEFELDPPSPEPAPVPRTVPPPETDEIGTARVGPGRLDVQ